MTSYVLTSEYERQDAIGALKELPLPCTLTMVKGAKRTLSQNALQHLWMNESDASIAQSQTLSETNLSTVQMQWSIHDICTF